MKLPSIKIPPPTCSVCGSTMMKRWGKWQCPTFFTHPEVGKPVFQKSEYQKALEKGLSLKE